MKIKQDLTEEKRKLIIEAALNEFAKQGYVKASTNSITKNAGVSKGLLFHYFGSKKSLYLSVIDWAIDHSNAYFDRKITDLPNEIIDCIIEVNIMKFNFFTQHPLMQKLLSAAFLEPPEELKEELQKREEEMMNKYMPVITGKVDMESFREGVESAKAIELVIILVNAIAEKHIKSYREVKFEDNTVMINFIKDLEIYLGMIKRGIYRQ